MTDFKAKMHLIRFRLGLCPRPRWGSLQHSPRPPSWIWGALLLRGGEERGRKGRAMSPPPTIWRKFTPMCSIAALKQAYNCFAAHLLPCSLFKSVKKFAVRVCPVTIVVMETMQLFLSQFINLLQSTENQIMSLSTKNN